MPWISIARLNLRHAGQNIALKRKDWRVLHRRKGFKDDVVVFRKVETGSLDEAIDERT